MYVTRQSCDSFHQIYMMKSCHSGLSHNFVVQYLLRKYSFVGGIKKIPEKWAKNDGKNNDSTVHFCGLNRRIKNTMLWYNVIKLYTYPDDLLFLLLAFWMIRASALQFARSLVRSTDGWKNKLACSNFYLERNLLFSYIVFTIQK